VSNDHSEPHDYHDGAELEHQQQGSAAARSSDVASGVTGTSAAPVATAPAPAAAIPVAAEAASTVAARSVQQGVQHKATAAATTTTTAAAAAAAAATTTTAAAAAPAVAAPAVSAAVAAAAAGPAAATAAEQQHHAEDKQIDTAAVREALTPVLRLVLAMSNTHMQVLVSNADLWQQSLYALQYDAPVAFNTLQSLFKPDCTLSWSCMLCDLLVLNKYTTLVQHTGRCSSHTAALTN
jgi:hypothetical protein